MTATERQAEREAFRQFDENMRQMNRELERRRMYFLRCWLAVKYGLASPWEPRKVECPAEVESYDGFQLESVRPTGEKANP